MPMRAGGWNSCAVTSLRPALTNVRVQLNSPGKVVLKLKPAWRYGTTHIVRWTLEFMQRLAALALLNDRFQALNLAERVRELGQMRVCATPICTSAPCHNQSLTVIW